MGGKKGIPQLRTYGSTHLCHSSKRYPCASQCTIHTDRHYQHPTRHVSYNNGQYETESIYERKYLDGSDQYAVFLNSNQAQTVIKGSGESGKLLLIKDSYGNTFSQFPVEDYAEVHVIDLRFFRSDVVEYAKENGITDTLVLYGTQNFVKDTNITESV